MSQSDSNPTTGSGRPIVYIIGAVVVIALVYFATTEYQARQAPLSQPVAVEVAPAPEPETAAPVEEKDFVPVSAQDLQVQPDWY
jgi:hypothetical protein